jgi:hypothetical protein
LTNTALDRGHDRPCDRTLVVGLGSECWSVYAALERSKAMRAIDAIRIALKFSDMSMKHLGEMSDAPLLRPGPWGGNHAMWIAGHLTVVEGRLHQMLRGTPNPVARWKPLFDWGSEPVDDPAAYPPFEEVLRTFKQLREQTHAFLDEVGEEGLISRRRVSRRGSPDSRRQAPRSSSSPATRAATWAG